MHVIYAPKKENIKLFTKKSSIIGKRYISVLNFDEAISFGDDAILFPFGDSPHQVSFFEVWVFRIQHFTYSISNYWLREKKN